MVSLMDIDKYQIRINESSKLKAFNSLLFSRPFKLATDSYSDEIDEIYFGIVKAIQLNDRSSFGFYYDKKKKSNPSKDSPAPFINDDFLIFCLIVGIIKFEKDKTWIKNIISLRNRNDITITLENILTENYFSKSNLPETVLIFMQLCNKSLINQDILNASYKSISNNTKLFESKSDFHIICALRAYDLIIDLKEVSDGSEIKALKEFNIIFLKRIRLISWIVQSLILILIFYFVFKLISNYQPIKNFVDQIGSMAELLGIVGLSQLGNLYPLIQKKSYQIILRLFGYPLYLLKKE